MDCFVVPPRDDAKRRGGKAQRGVWLSSMGDRGSWFDGLTNGPR